MMFVSFLPFSKVDWAATGAMIGALGTISVTLFIAFRQWKLDKKNSELEAKLNRNEQKIFLFEKRYRIFDLFFNYYKLCVESLCKCESSSNDFFAFLRGALISHPSNLSARLEYYSSDRPVGNFSSENYLAAFARKQAVEKRSEFYDENFFEQNRYILHMSEFCFNKEISDVIIKLSDLINIGLFRGKVGSSEKSEAEKDAFEEIKKLLSKIKSEKTIEKIKVILNLEF